MYPSSIKKLKCHPIWFWMMESLKKLLIKKLAKENKQKKMSLKSNRKRPNKDDLKKKPKLTQKNWENDQD